MPYVHPFTPRMWAAMQTAPAQCYGAFLEAMAERRRFTSFHAFYLQDRP